MAGHTLKRRLWRWTPGAFVVAFALSLALFGGTGYAEPNNVHTAVFQWAAEHPGENVPVILRFSGDEASAGATIGTFGGEVNQNLDFISAIQAEVPASSLNGLASSSDVSYISLDAPIQTVDDKLFDAGKVASEFPTAVKAPDVWNKGYYGNGVGVAVVDTGVSPVTNPDFTGYYGNSRVVASVAISSAATSTNDGYGHGTHIAGLIASDGDLNHNKYPGVAPRANIINVKISDDLGVSTLGGLIGGLQWVYQNRTQYNIRVVNLSLHSSTAESYKTSPVDAAVELLWKNGVFVTVASGNTGNAPDAVNYPPSNDPFVMSVGAIDDKGTDATGDDVVASFSSAGTTQDGFTKPELLTSGVGLVSDTDVNSILYLQGLVQGKVITPGPYLKLSGTSMAAGVMSGVAALEYQRHPLWTPGQLKCSLIAKARTLSPPPGTPAPPPGSSVLGRAVPRAGDTFNLAVPSCDSDIGITPARGLAAALVVPLVGTVAYVLSQPDPAAAQIGLDPVAANFITTSPSDPTVALSIDTVDWSAINWNAIQWDAINWYLIKWDSIKWDSIKWDSIKWDSIKWDSIKWDSIKWDSIKWDSIKWDSIKWDSIKWDSIKWDSIKWDSIKWDSVGFDSVGFDSATGEEVAAGASSEAAQQVTATDTVAFTSTDTPVVSVTPVVPVTPVTTSP